ncbi:MAG: MbtH family protein [Enterobacteriaceae bacterium]
MQQQLNETTYQVLKNDEGQYSLWPEDKMIPAGWLSVGKTGSKNDCLEYIKNVWTDMRPSSLIKTMQGRSQ